MKKNLAMRLRRLQNWRGLLAVLAVFAGAALLATPAPGYLPGVGPAPLRFFSLPLPHINCVAVVQPAKLPEPKPQTVAQIAQPKPTPAPQPVAAMVTNAVTNTDESQQPKSIPQSTGDNVVPPEMLLKYFGRPANPGPVDPNAAGNPHASSATYTIGP